MTTNVTASTALSLDRVSKAFPTRSGSVEALRGVSFDVFGGEFYSIVGPSGCGKSTLLNVIAGLEPEDEGEIFLNIHPITGATGTNEDVCHFDRSATSGMPAHKKQTSTASRAVEKSEEPYSNWSRPRDLSTPHHRKGWFLRAVLDRWFGGASVEMTEAESRDPEFSSSADRALGMSIRDDVKRNHSSKSRLGTIAYMPQKDLLLPWRTVLENAALGLELTGVPRSDARKRASNLLARFGLDGFADSYPAALSGGMRQRAAFLRTILTDRSLMLLDEPFGALDALTRRSMQEWLLDIWSDMQRTVVLITHDVEEAIFLSDRVAVMSPRPGRIIAEHRIDLPRPRHADMVTDSAFVEIKRAVMTDLRSGLEGDSRAPE